MTVFGQFEPVEQDFRPSAPEPAIDDRRGHVGAALRIAEKAFSPANHLPPLSCLVQFRVSTSARIC